MLLVFYLLSLLPAAAPTPAAPAITPVVLAAASTYQGFLLTEAGDAVVELLPQGTGYVGRVVAFRKTGTTTQSKSRLNSVMLKDLRPDGQELSGRVINPDTGKDYKATLALNGANTLELRVKAMGVTVHTETWTRQPTGR